MKHKNPLSSDKRETRSLNRYHRSFSLYKTTAELEKLKQCVRAHHIHFSMNAKIESIRMERIE